ncbi:peroxisomal dehydratase [Atractiella rhizophila]|nr:peroxisomal dehydratase [Atractiella rhizophila]
MSGVDLPSVIGKKISEQAVSWTKRDLILYALSIGATAEDLQYVYELSPKMKVFPTFPLVLGFKGTSHEVVNFETARMGEKVKGLPKLDSKKLVHAEQSVIVLKELPLVGEGFKLISEYSGVHDKGKNLIVESMSTLIGPDGKEYVKTVSSSFNFGAGGHGGFSKSVAPKFPVSAKAKPPSRNPDAVVALKTSPDQAALYRLSGDYNPLHIDPSIGPQMGFKGAILHGLCSYGHAAMSISKSFPGYKLVGMSSRFTSPVYPGETLETLIWKEEKGDKVEVDFIQRVKETGKVCLGGGVALLVKEDGKSKL